MGTPNWANRTMWTGDNLDIMRGMNDDTVDLIYLDPPFNSNKNYSAPVGSEAAGAAFKDTWTLDDLKVEYHGWLADREPELYAAVDAARRTHGRGMMAYLLMMGIRLVEMRRLLKPTGSIYLHCDQYAGHYLKILMDSIFGSGNFRREIIWDIAVLSGYKTQARNWIRGHDIVLYYTRSAEHVFNRQSQPHRKEYLDRFNKTDPRGRRYFDGRGKRRYLDDVIKKGKPVGDVWSDIMSFQQIPTSKEKVGYPTQKPLVLLERIIKASSNEGDVILDPFCGCATACVAAERLNRQWVGIDLSSMALRLVTRRIKQNIGMFAYDITERTDIPKRTDQGKIPDYRTHKHRLYGMQEGFCLCGEHFQFRNLTVDHVVPKSRGGTDHISNLQLLCGACNSKKGVKDQAWLLAKLKEDGITPLLTAAPPRSQKI